MKKIMEELKKKLFSKSFINKTQTLEQNEMRLPQKAVQMLNNMLSLKLNKKNKIN